jgi:hypothetical protein
MSYEERSRRIEIALQRLLDVSLELIDELTDKDTVVSPMVTLDRLVRYVAWSNEAEFLLDGGT